MEETLIGFSTYVNHVHYRYVIKLKYLQNIHYVITINQTVYLSASITNLKVYSGFNLILRAYTRLSEIHEEISNQLVS
jgi:hypothetical protein